MADRLVNVTLTANTAPYVAGMNSATAATQRTAASTATMSAGMKRTGASMATTAGQAGLLRSSLVTPIAAAGAAIIGTTKASIDWESSWAGVTKTVDGSATQMERLEGDLRNMAKELPATHGEIAGVAEAAGQLGIAVDDVAAFSRVMVDLGETTNLSAEQAATSIARFGNIMGTAEGDVERLGSSLVDLGNNSETTEAEILAFSTRLAAAGNIAGLSESDVLAFGAALTSVGVEAEAGGTALSKTFTTIRDAVLNGGRELETFAEVAGVTADEFATAFREDPAMAIASFIAGLGEMNARGESTTQVFDDLGLANERTKRALNSTAEAGDLLVDSIKLASDAWEENNALSEEAQNRYDTVAASLSRSRNQITDAAIDIGDVLAPTVEKLSSDFATLVGWVQRAATEIEGLPSRIPGVDADAGPEPAIDNLFGVGPPVLDWSVLWDDTAEATDNATDSTAKFKSEIKGLQNRLPAATEEARTYRTAQLEVSDATVTATESLANYQDQLLAATDPVFNLQQKLTAVDEAQKAYDETLKDSEATQADVEAAAFGVAEAVAAAEQAAINGDLSFEAFDARLNRWVEQGVISAEVADDIRGRVEDLTGASEDYDGTYTGQMDVEGEARSRSEIQGLINRAERYDRNWDANLGVHGTAKARSEIQGLLNRAAAFSGTYTATFVSNFVSSSGAGNLFAGRHQGGPIMHDGGPVNAGVTRMHDGGLRTDERVIVAQQGEFMMQASAVDRFGVGAMHAINQGRAIPASTAGGASGVMEIRNTFVGVGPQGEAIAQMVNYALNKGQLNIKTEAIQR